MLNEKDLQAIAELIDLKLINIETLLRIRTNILEEKIAIVRETLTDEFVRKGDIITCKTEKNETELNEIKEYYRINSRESDKIDLILRILEGFQKRLEVLEKKLA